MSHPTAQRLLESAELARLAYVGTDGTPRVLPMLFDWTGDEIVFGAHANSRKLDPPAGGDVGMRDACGANKCQ